MSQRHEDQKLNKDKTLLEFLSECVENMKFNETWKEMVEEVDTWSRDLITHWENVDKIFNELDTNPKKKRFCIYLLSDLNRNGFNINNYENFVSDTKKPTSIADFVIPSSLTPTASRANFTSIFVSKNFLQMIANTYKNHRKKLHEDKIPYRQILKTDLIFNGEFNPRMFDEEEVSFVSSDPISQPADPISQLKCQPADPQAEIQAEIQAELQADPISQPRLISTPEPTQANLYPISQTADPISQLNGQQPESQPESQPDPINTECERMESANHEDSVLSTHMYEELQNLTRQIQHQGKLATERYERFAYGEDRKSRYVNSGSIDLTGGGPFSFDFDGEIENFALSNPRSHFSLILEIRLMFDLEKILANLQDVNFALVRKYEEQDQDGNMVEKEEEVFREEHANLFFLSPEEILTEINRIHGANKFRYSPYGLTLGIYEFEFNINGDEWVKVYIESQPQNPTLDFIFGGKNVGRPRINPFRTLKLELDNGRKIVNLAQIFIEPNDVNLRITTRKIQLESIDYVGQAKVNLIFDDVTYGANDFSCYFKSFEMILHVS